MIEMQRQIEDLLGYVREGGGEAPGGAVAPAPREALVRAAANQLKPVDLF
jgi:hypothetical protein